MITRFTSNLTYGFGTRCDERTSVKTALKSENDLVLRENDATKTGSRLEITAKAIGLAIPDSILVLADEVIE
jgi:hypothetical protein